MHRSALSWLIACASIVWLLLAAGCARPAQAAKPLTYVAIGASDAVGIGVANPEQQGWVPRFAAALGPDTHLVNLGVSGSTLRQARYEQLGPALDTHPDVVTVWLAVNDLNAGVSLDDYTGDLDRMLEDLETTGARVLVGNVPDLSRVAVYAQVDAPRLQAEVQRWNAAIAQVAAAHHAQVVDLYAGWHELAQHPEYVSADGFHPSAEGYQRLADLFAQAYASGN